MPRPYSVTALGARDGVVQVSVQGAKVLDADGRLQFQREIGDGLADVAVVVHYLGDRESLEMQIASVACGAGADIRSRRRVVLQRIDELIEEAGDAVLEFGRCWRWNRAQFDLRPAPANNLVPVFCDKRVKHGANTTSQRPTWESNQHRLEPRTRGLQEREDCYRLCLVAAAYSEPTHSRLYACRG